MSNKNRQAHDAVRYGTLACIFLLLIFVPSVVMADPITINFEGLADGARVTNQIPGLMFMNATTITSGISLNEFEFPPHSGTNVVFDDGGAMSVTFASPVTSFSGYFTHTVRLTLSAYDSNNNLLLSTTSVFTNNLALSGDLGSHSNELIFLSFVNGISRITIVGDPSGNSFTMDDMTVSNSAAVPEPSAIILFLTGSAALLIFGKRRST
jgi:hypothetical protein